MIERDRIVVYLSWYTRTPGSRYESDGEHSAERFRNRWLIPLYRSATDHGITMEVNLDGVAGVAATFLEETFGGLVRQAHHFDPELLVITCEDEPELVDEAWNYIAAAMELRNAEERPPRAV